LEWLQDALPLDQPAITPRLDVSTPPLFQKQNIVTGACDHQIATRTFFIYNKGRVPKTGVLFLKLLTMPCASPQQCAYPAGRFLSWHSPKTVLEATPQF
jgi:hypothetical protein